MTAFVQETENVSSWKTRVTREVIYTYTGRPPKDAYEIRDLIRVIEQRLSDFEIEDFNLPVDGNRRGTLPIDCDVWDKFTDWQTLDEGQKQETQTFLLMNFSVEDLQLAYDQYFVQRGHIPSSVAYRIFINNWRGNEMRRTQSLAEMVTTIGQQVEEIERGREEKQIKISQLNFITAIRDGLLWRVRDLENENEHLHNNVQRLERDCEQERHDKDRLRVVINSRDRQVYELEQNVNKKDHQLFDSNRELKDTKDELKDTKDELKDTKDELKHTKYELKHTKDELKHTKDELKHTKDDLEHTKDDLEHTKYELKHTKDELKHTKDDLKHTKDDLEHTKDDLKHTKDELKHTKDDLKHTKDDLEHTKDDLKHTKDDLEHTKDDLKHTKDDLEHTKDDLKHTKDELKDTIDDLEHTKDELKNLREENVEQRSTIDKQSATISELKATIKQITLLFMGSLFMLLVIFLL